MLNAAIAGASSLGAFSKYNTEACRRCQTDVADRLSEDSSLFKRARGWKDSLVSFFGRGDYSLKSNSLVDAGGVARDDLQITPAGPREVRIVYREYIGDIVSDISGGFKYSSYLINPGNPLLFPWLSSIAQSFEQWTPNGIMFEFKSTSSEYVSSQALGSVIMATDYDTYDGNFNNKVEMLNSAYANEAKPSQHILHGIECDPRDTPNMIMYVDHGSVPQGGDERDYYLGRFQIATQGGPASAVTLGSLYIHYDITFRKEVVPRSLAVAHWAKFSLKPPTAGLLAPFGVPDAYLNGAYGDFSITYDGSSWAEIHLPVSLVTRYYQMTLLHVLTSGGTGNLLVDDVVQGVHTNGSIVSLSWGSTTTASTWGISPSLPATVGIKYWVNTWVAKSNGTNIETVIRFNAAAGGLAEAGKVLTHCTLSISEVSEDFATQVPLDFAT